MSYLLSIIQQRILVIKSEKFSKRKRDCEISNTVFDSFIRGLEEDFLMCLWKQFVCQYQRHGDKSAMVMEQPSLAIKLKAAEKLFVENREEKMQKALRGLFIDIRHYYISHL